MNAVDTNVLIYSNDDRYPTKKVKARTLIAALDEPVLLWQVAVEYVSASRKLVALGLDPNVPWADIRGLQRIWRVVLPDWSVLDEVEALQQRFSLSFWDALLVAACLEGGVKRLYSEDFGPYPNIDGLEIVDPFK